MFDHPASREGGLSTREARGASTHGVDERT